MKLFGDEVKFMEIKQENIKQFAQDIADILQGKKERVEYLDKGKRHHLILRFII